MNSVYAPARPPKSIQKKSSTWRWWLAMAVIVAGIIYVVFFLSPTRASAQTLEGVAMPSNTVMQSFIACMQATGLTKTCRELAEREARRSEKVANEAADKAKNSRPIVVDGGYVRPYGSSVYGYRDEAIYGTGVWGRR